MAEHAGDQRFRAASLLQGAVDVLLAHPLQLLLPLVILGVLTSGGDDNPMAYASAPWWLFPFVAAVALLALVIVIALVVLQVIVWFVTVFAALQSLRTHAAPRLGDAWQTVRHKLAPSRIGETASRAWALASGHVLDLAVAFVVLALISLGVSLVTRWMPVIGGPLAGIANGAMAAMFAATLAVYYHRRLDHDPDPPVVAAPAVL